MPASRPINPSPTIACFLAVLVLLKGEYLFSQRTKPVPPPSSITQISPAAITTTGAMQHEEALILPPKNVRVNQNLSSLKLPQTEPSVTSNPHSPLQLVAGFADDAVGDFA